LGPPVDIEDANSLPHKKAYSNVEIVDYH